MRNKIRRLCASPKDVIALILIGSYCVSYLCTVLVPDIHFNEMLGRQFERLILVVVGYYFSSRGNISIDNETKCDNIIDHERNRH